MTRSLPLFVGLALGLGCSPASEKPASVAAGTPRPPAAVSPTPRAPTSPPADIARTRATPARPPNLDSSLREARSGTLLLRAHSDGALAPATTLETSVDIHVTGLLARVRVEQRFANPADLWAEGVYVFPLPDDAAVDRLRMFVDGRVLEGEVREKAAARRVYTTAREQGRPASLVEQQRPNVFTSFVANIAPHSEIAIEIEYQQRVRLDQGELSLRFPTVVAPRYEREEDRGESGSPIGNASGSGNGNASGNANGPAPTGVVGAEPLLQPHFVPADEAPASAVRIRVDLAPGFAVAAIESPYHTIRILEHSDRYEIELADDSAPADRDFELRWRPAAGAEPQLALFTEAFDGAYYALLMLMPPAAARPGPRTSREMVFVLDTSGSMASTSIRQAKAALALALHRLDAGDRFNVIEFDSDARALFESAREATARNVDEALDWLDSLEARGGTEILPALELALRGDAPAGFLRQIVFLTDGAVANEEELLAHVRAGLRESRIFAVGIGSAPNGYLMRKLAELGRGSFTHIGKPEEVAERMEALLRKLDTVALSDIELVLPRGVDVEAYPNPLPDLYEGEPVVVALELDAPLAWASVRGMRGDEPWESIVGRRDEEQRPGVHVLWARRKIDALMHRPGPGSTAVLTERRRLATAVALAHQLVSRFTSLVVVDRTPVRRDNEELRTRPLAARLPAGADAARYFGFEQGASAAPLHRILGLALLCAASIAARLRNPRRGVSS